MIKHACGKVGCAELLDKPGYCTKHDRGLFQEADELSYERKRGSSAQRGYGARWQKVRYSYLVSHPLCAICKEAATVVDHIIPHRGDGSLFWDYDNWQSLCKGCHDKKTLSERVTFTSNWDVRTSTRIIGKGTKVRDLL